MPTALPINNTIKLYHILKWEVTNLQLEVYRAEYVYGPRSTSSPKVYIKRPSPFCIILKFSHLLWLSQISNWNSRLLLYLTCNGFIGLTFLGPSNVNCHGSNVCNVSLQNSDASILTPSERTRGGWVTWVELLWMVLLKGFPRILVFSACVDKQEALSGHQKLALSKQQMTASILVLNFETPEIWGISFYHL